MTVFKMTEAEAKHYLSLWAKCDFKASRIYNLDNSVSDKQWRRRICIAKTICKDSGITVVDVPEKMRFTKTTVQYDQNGHVIQEWRRLAKEQADPEKIAEAVKKICGGCIPRLPSIKVDKKNDLCLVIPIYDLHIGKYAWAKESGEDYDLDIVRKIVTNTVAIMCQRVGIVKKIIFIAGGDWYHADNRTMQTERGGNVLDIDTRIEKVREVSLKSIHECVGVMSRHCRELEMVFIPGNHDFESMMWTAHCMEGAYSKSKHITINRGPKTRRYIQHGTTLLGIDHGENKMTDYVSLMPCEVPDLWAQTTERLWLLGHIHQQKVIQKHGVTVEHLESVSAADGWHFQHGYVGNPRRTVGFLFDGKYGLVSRHYVKAQEALQ